MEMLINMSIVLRFGGSILIVQDDRFDFGKHFRGWKDQASEGLLGDSLPQVCNKWSLGSFANEQGRGACSTAIRSVKGARRWSGARWVEWAVASWDISTSIYECIYEPPCVY